MPLRSALLRWRNLVRFRAALRRVEGDHSFTERLMHWRALAHERGWEFVPGTPLGASQLRGTYDGLPVRIGLVADEVRVLTTFSIRLPGAPRSELLDAIARQTNLRERTSMLLDAFEEHRRGSSGAAYRTDAPRVAAGDIRQILAWCDLSMSETHLYGTARYVSEGPAYAEILAVMGAMSRALTSGRAGS